MAPGIKYFTLTLFVLKLATYFCSLFISFFGTESIINHQYSFKTDSFAFGVLLWELFTR